MRLSLALWTSLLSVSVLADPGKSWADKGDDGHHFSGKNWRHKTNNLKARTHTGTFTGFVDPEVPDVNQWLGIPYGAPPTGDQRFLPPKPAAHAGDISTTEFKPICMQNGLGTRPADSTSGGIFWALVPEFQNQDPQSEDCLYLNIWGPRKSIGKGRRPKHQKKVPVIIWICGGGYQEGGGHAPYQVPDHWIQRTQSHIVVTFNYRLSVWGFPGARAAPVNAGLADIRLVVEWLRENIEAFGGDPDHMVLWGQSAGGNAANSYGYAYPEDPIVAGIVAQSGTVSQLNSPNTTAFTILAKQFGCDGLDAEEELTCMQQAPNDRLHSVIRNGTGVPRFSPAVDDVTLFANNTARLESGLVAKVPLILGNTINEGAAFAPFQLNQTQPPPEATTLSFLQRIGCGVEVETSLRKQFGLQSYRYLSAGNFSNITPRYWLGAMHSADIPLVFGTHWEFRGNSTELEWETSYSMEGFWLALASQGSDSDDELKDGLGRSWPEYGSEGEKMILFGDVEGGAAKIVPGDYFDGVYMCENEEEEG